MSLETVWFCIIAFFWTGYLFLEGFDFGVGMLLPVLGRNDTERRVMVNTIGPVWDGNEVWLIVAAGATFAAFPAWCASLFSSAYLPLLLVLLALIGRGVAFDYRGKADSLRWRRNWDRLIILGSWLPSFGVGLLLATTTLGLPLNARGDRVGSGFSAVRWDTVLGGVAVVGFALVHGAVFLALKTEGELRERARKLALRLLPVALLPMLAFLIVVQSRAGSVWTMLPLVVAFAAGPDSNSGAHSSGRSSAVVTLANMPQAKKSATWSAGAPLSRCTSSKSALNSLAFMMSVATLSPGGMSLRA